MKVLVEVKSKHIKNGVRASCTDCPIGLALREVYGPLLHPYDIVVNVEDSKKIRLRHLTFKMSRAAVRFAEKFDAGEPVKPIKFWISMKQ